MIYYVSKEDTFWNVSYDLIFKIHLGFSTVKCVHFLRTRFTKDLFLKHNSFLSLHNGGNDSHKRQFLALGVCSQSWKLNKLSKKISCQIDWCYMLLATIWQKMFLLSNVDCKVSNLWNKIADKRGQLALISKCQFVSGNII